MNIFEGLDQPLWWTYGPDNFRCISCEWVVLKENDYKCLNPHCYKRNVEECEKAKIRIAEHGA